MKYFVLFIGLMLFVSCKKVECDAFPSELKAYFPYEKSQLLWYTNEQNDTLVFKMESVSFSEKFSFKPNCKCACESTAYFNSQTDSEEYSFVEGQVFVNEFELGFSFNFDANDYFTFHREIEGSEYQVIEDTLELENLAVEQIDKLVLIKGKGIVSFKDVKNDYIWTLQE